MEKNTLLLCRCPLSFFGLGPNYRAILHKLLFDMAYYSQGGFNWSDLYTMPVHLRRFYLDKLKEVKKKEKEDVEKQNKKSTPRMPRKR